MNFWQLCLCCPTKSNSMYALSRPVFACIVYGCRIADVYIFVSSYIYHQIKEKKCMYLILFISFFSFLSFYILCKIKHYTKFFHQKQFYQIRNKKKINMQQKMPQSDKVYLSLEDGSTAKNIYNSTTTPTNHHHHQMGILDSVKKVIEHAIVGEKQENELLLSSKMTIGSNGPTIISSRYVKRNRKTYCTVVKWCECCPI